MKHKTIKPLPVLEKSGFDPKPGKIETFKVKNYFIVTDIAITGDAPKDFIRFYEYGHGRRKNTKRWQLFLAKLGHKHYPVESITELLLSRIGEYFGFNIAGARLAYLGGQIRFLSKYFLSNPAIQVLEHGAELYAGYLNDKEFVEKVEEDNKARELFTVQVTNEVIKHFYKEQADEIFKEYIKMLVFDAIIGNNDRHFYNWGVINDVKGIQKPVFSPIYDTARALFWNYHENRIQELANDKNYRNAHINKYVENSFPKTGWDGYTKINHFELMNKLHEEGFLENIQIIKDIFYSGSFIHDVLNRINKDFKGILSQERINLINYCLLYRYDTIRKILKFAP
ncbi:MAG: HipA domain-containing protein [Bacteroidota bacterium]